MTLEAVATIAVWALVGIPASLVLLELFWFAGRCPEGGQHEWAPHPAEYLSAAWVQCGKCGLEDY